MENKNITGYDEFLKNSITEQSTYSKIPLHITVCGGQNEHGLPHFHLWFKNVEYKILIPLTKKTVEIGIEDINETNDSPTLPNDLIKEKIVEFLKSDCDDPADRITKSNIKEISITWNIVNKFNPSVYVYVDTDVFGESSIYKNWL